MRFSSTCFFLTFFFFQVKPSAAQEYRLKGYLGVEGGESFNYVLEFKDSLGYISGYSYTYQQEKKDVKAAITGVLDRVNQTLSFQENQLIYNHGFESYATICLIKAILKFNKNGDQLVFSGSITSSDITNVSCSGGSIAITGTDALKEVFEKVTIREKETVRKPENTSKNISKPMKVAYDTAAQKSTVPTILNNIDKITDGIAKTYFGESDTIILEVWDGGKVDGDKISVLINDAVYLDNYTLKRAKKKLIIPLHGNEVTISIIAENEGNEAPNTTDIFLTDGKVKHNLFAYNMFGKSAHIRCRRK